MFSSTLLLMTFLILPSCLGLTVTISRGYTKEGTELNITQCNPTHELMDSKGSLFSLTGNGDCMNLYPNDESCTGSFIRYQSPHKNDLFIPKTHKWSTDDNNQAQFVQENFRMKSIGPCFPQCDPRNWDGVAEKTKVVLYSDFSFKGSGIEMTIEGNGCFLIPKNLKSSLYSIGISGSSPDQGCIELHNSPRCQGYSTQLRPGYPSLDRLYNWGLSGPDAGGEVVAISLCGAFCNITEPNVKSLPEGYDRRGEGVVTIYDDYGYYGNSLNLNLTNRNCTYLYGKFNVKSIRTYNQCVNLYENTNCQDHSGSNMLQTMGKSADYYESKLLTLKIANGFKSAKLCPQVKVDARKGHTLRNTTGAICIQTVWGLLPLLLVVFGLIVLAIIFGFFVFRVLMKITLHEKQKRTSKLSGQKLIFLRNISFDDMAGLYIRNN